MSFDRLVANTQAGTYKGLNEYPNKNKDFDGHWGIPDEPYLQYVTTELTQQKEPFSTVFNFHLIILMRFLRPIKTNLKVDYYSIHATVEYVYGLRFKKLF